MKSLHNLALASVEAYQNEMVKGTGGAVCIVPCGRVWKSSRAA